jgi:anti-sigma factor RsiW
VVDDAAARRKKSLWSRLPAAWKALGLCGAIAGAGWVGHEYMSRFVTHAELDASSGSTHALTEKVNHLGEVVARQSGEIAAAAAQAKHADDGITELLIRLVEHPPPRGGQGGGR